MPHRLERRKARAAARAIADKRRHYRVALPLRARMLHENGRETGCAVANISPGGLAGYADLTPRVNSRVVIVIDALGRAEGRVKRVSGTSFSLHFDTMTPRRRDRLADRLIWEINRAKLGLTDRRSAARGL